MRVEIEVDFEAECNECGATLTIQDVPKSLGRVTVLPCRDCLDKADESGHDRGYEKGDSDGYERGLSDGRAEASGASS